MSVKGETVEERKAEVLIKLRKYKFITKEKHEGAFAYIIDIPEDKQKAVNEYVRVTKPGGYVGLNESTWLKFPPPPELVAWASQDLGANVKPLTTSE